MKAIQSAVICFTTLIEMFLLTINTLKPFLINKARDTNDKLV